MEWDQKEAKLLAVETKKAEGNPQTNSAATGNKKDEEKKQKAQNEQKEMDGKDERKADSSSSPSTGSDSQSAGKHDSDAEVTTLFATSDHGILMQDSFAIDSTFESLIGLSVPFIQLMHRPIDVDDSGALAPRLKRRVMRDFVGLENENEETKQNLLAFSYYLTVGNMDDAYRAVKKINSNSIWDNMAQMCVKTKRLDVAEVCLGNMNNARGARAVREAKKEEEKDAQVAMLAIQLGMNEDAERLYRECGRYDLLVKLYMASNRWKEAVEMAGKFDRIHLKCTHYLYGKHLEALGSSVEAINQYEKAECHRYEVPRMLFDAQRIRELEDYISASSDSVLYKWWAQYNESNQRYEEALKYYSEAKDTLALVRIYCFLHNEDMAREICLQSNDLAACYHLGRQYENQGQFKEAIQLYTKAKRYNHGIRLAKEHDMENELLALSLESSSKDLMNEAAKYFEDKQSFEKAVLLYEKGGKVTRALDLCFKAQLFDALRQISDSLSSDTDPALLSKCGEFFLQHSQFEKAVQLFISAKDYLKALNLCLKHNVKISEAMAEKLTPAKGKTDAEKEERNSLLKKLAHICKDQGSYHLACKKYTQAGDHERAMKCLLKSNDNEKIIYYATMTKKPEVYKLAANYLQNLDWHNDAEIMKTIINFYTKAKAWAALSSFYDACAQVEIDEYRDYEKAYDALQLSMNYLLKSKAAKEKDKDKDKDAKGKEDKLDSLQARINLVSKFVEARKLVKTDPDEMIKLCNQLYETPEVESAIRVGDVFALLIEYYYSIRKFQEAYGIIEKMRAANIILSPYLDQSMVQAIHKAVGAEMQAEPAQEQQQEAAIQEELNEAADE